MMGKRIKTLPESLRIIFTITSKDVRDLVSNRILIIMLVGISIMMGLNYGVFLLAGQSQKPFLAIFDETDHAIAEKLEVQEDFILINAPSKKVLTKMIAESRTLILGIMFTEETGNEIMSEHEQNNEPVELISYAPYWANEVDRKKREGFFEAELSSLFQTQIQFRSIGDIVYPDRESDGQPFKVAIYLTIGILFSAASISPFLMVEEKQSRTIDSLLVSPANYVQIVISKFISGLVPGLICGLFILGVNHNMVTHWPFALLVLLLGNAMFVAIGLLIGLSTNNPVNLSLFLLVILFLLLTPIFIAQSTPPQWPEIIQGIVKYFPSTAFSRLMRDAFTLNLPLNSILPDLGSLIGSSILFFCFLIWKLSRIDR